MSDDKVNNSTILSDQARSYQTFLDDKPYSYKGITRYEQIFGETFVSTGGVETTEQFCENLNLKDGSLVLDVGCGTGGSAFVMARKYGAHVHGIDLSTNMITLANRNRQKMAPGVKHRTQFNLEDALNMDYPKNFYDVVYSRDSILHIKEKDYLFKKLYETLKPGGILFITDYMAGETKPNEEFEAYVKDRAYTLITLEEYEKTLRKASFHEVKSTNGDKQFLEILQKELDNFKPKKEEFLKTFSMDDYNAISDGWSAKLKRVAEGYQSWGYVLARKSYTQD